MDKELTMKIMFGICLVVFLTFFIIEMKNMNIKYIVYNFEKNLTFLILLYIIY